MNIHVHFIFLFHFMKLQTTYYKKQNIKKNGLKVMTVTQIDIVIGIDKKKLSLENLEFVPL